MMEGLVVRPPRPEDAEDLHALRTQPGVVWGTLQMPSLTLERARSRLQAQLLDLAQAPPRAGSGAAPN
jgi:hypothetical protein